MCKNISATLQSEKIIVSHLIKKKCFENDEVKSVAAYLFLLLMKTSPESTVWLIQSHSATLQIRFTERSPMLFWPVCNVCTYLAFPHTYIRGGDHERKRNREREKEKDREIEIQREKNNHTQTQEIKNYNEKINTTFVVYFIKRM